MLFSFGKNASNSVFKTANHFKDVIEKKVNKKYWLQAFFK